LNNQNKVTFQIVKPIQSFPDNTDTAPVLDSANIFK